VGRPGLTLPPMCWRSCTHVAAGARRGCCACRPTCGRACWRSCAHRRRRQRMQVRAERKALLACTVALPTDAGAHPVCGRITKRGVGQGLMLAVVCSCHLMSRVKPLYLSCSSPHSCCCKLFAI
jgi:hypothetical protein